MAQPLIKLRAGRPIDHIAICGSDTRQAAKEVESITGVTPQLPDPKPGQFYWSAVVPLGAGRFLEILGPHPNYRGFNPLIETVRRFDRVRPVFWYVATDDFEAFSDASKKAGGPVEKVQRVKYESPSVKFDYTNGVVGPGFRSARPCVIQWRERPSYVGEEEMLTLRALRLSDPNADRLRTLFDSLGIDQQVDTGPATIAVDLDTPKGPVTFEGPGFSFEGVGRFARLMGLYIRYRLSRRQAAEQVTP